MGLSLVLALQLAPGQSVQAEPQVDVRIRVKAHDWLGAAFEQRIGNGPATVSGQIYNLTGRQTSLVTLHFDYQSHK